MPCPLRPFLAAASAAVAIVLWWRASSLGDSDVEARPRRGWLRLALDFFSGRYLWELYAARRAKRKGGKEEYEGHGGGGAAAAAAARGGGSGAPGCPLRRSARKRAAG